MEIRVLGAHCLESYDTRHTCFLIDGVLAVDAGSLASALTGEEQRRVLAVLLTHLHFDHIRDLPTVGLATLNEPKPIDVYSLPETRESIKRHFLNSQMYPDLTQPLGAIPAKYRFNQIQARVSFEVLSYRVNPIPVIHPVPTVGFVVESDAGGRVGYTGDTSGEILPFFQGSSAPSVLFVEVTFPDRLADLAQLTGHLTPATLGCQVEAALSAGLTVPKLVVVHMRPEHEEELLDQLTALARKLGIDLTLGHEGMRVIV